MLHSPTLHFPTLHSSTLNFPTKHVSTLHFPTFHFSSLHCPDLLWSQETLKGGMLCYGYPGDFHLCGNTAADRVSTGLDSNVDTVHCAVDTRHYGVYPGQWTLCTVQWTLDTMDCTLDTLHSTLYFSQAGWWQMPSFPAPTNQNLNYRSVQSCWYFQVVPAQKFEGLLLLLAPYYIYVISRPGKSGAALQTL